jgi:hypothetical protein
MLNVWLDLYLTPEEKSNGVILGEYGGQRDWSILSNPPEILPMSGISVEEGYLVERKCLVEGVPPARLQITQAQAYPGNVYPHLSALERWVQSHQGKKGGTTHSIWGYPICTQELQVVNCLY